MRLCLQGSTWHGLRGAGIPYMKRAYLTVHFAHEARVKQEQEADTRTKAKEQYEIWKEER